MNDAQPTNNVYLRPTTELIVWWQFGYRWSRVPWEEVRRWTA